MNRQNPDLQVFAVPSPTPKDSVQEELGPLLALSEPLLIEQLDQLKHDHEIVKKYTRPIPLQDITDYVRTKHKLEGKDQRAQGEVLWRYFEPDLEDNDGVPLQLTREGARQLLIDLGYIVDNSKGQATAS